MAERTAISVEFSPGLRRLLQQGPKAVVHGALIRAFDRENEYTIGAAVRDRMSFSRNQPSTMEGLRVQSGRLRRSLTRSPAKSFSDGVISAIGSNVKYFGIHEFGFQGSVTVPEHQRRLPDRFSLAGGMIVNRATAKQAGLLTKKGKARKGMAEQLPERYVLVRAHDRNANFPARQMVRKTVLARIPQYEAAVAAELQTALS